MKRLRPIGAALVAVIVSASAALAATEPSEVVDQLDLRGYFIDEGVDVDINEMERLVGESGGEPVYYVALADDPADGADLFATEALEGIVGDGTVVVVSPSEIGARSNVVDDGPLNDAIDASIDRFNTSYVDGFRSFAAALGGVPVPDVPLTTQASSTNTVSQAQPSGDSSGGGGGLVIFLLFILAIIGLVVFMVRRSKKRQEQAFGERIDEIKSQIRSQLGDVANDILELEDEVLLTDSEQAKDLYAAGSKGYAEFEAKLDGANSLAELHELAEGLDVTMWQLDAAEALVDDKPLPPKPADRPEYDPPARPQQPQPGEARHPELPEDLQMRRERRRPMPTGRPRRRSGGWLGGLGTAAVILKSLQQGRRRPRSTSSFRVPGTSSRRSGSSGVNVPNLGGGRRSSTPTRRRSGSSSSRTSKRPSRGRARRKR